MSVEKGRNGSRRPYRAGLVSCSLSWLIQLNEIPQRTGILTGLEERTQTQVCLSLRLAPLCPAIDLHLRAVKMPTAMPS